jgi:tetratricopeptide (TPR) repeat protein
LKVSPTNCDVVNEKGGILFYQKKFKEAIECFDIVIAAKPNDISAYNNKGMALKNLNKPDEALKCLEHVIQ